MTIRRALTRHLPPRVKRFIKSTIRPKLSTLSHRWTIARADLQPEDTVALVASAAEAAYLPSDVRGFVKAARAKGCVVRLYILDFDLAAPTPEFFDDAVRRFWIDAAPSHAGRISHHGMSIPSVLAEAPYPLPDGDWATGYYKNGQPMLVVTRYLGGTSLEHLDASGQSVRRDEFDQDGQLVRRIDLHPGTRKAVVRRYVDPSGRTWLRMRIGIEGADHPVRQLHPEARDYDALADVQVAWLRDHLRQTDRVRVLACGESSRPIMQRVQS
jgi:hypothetical protein